MIGNGRDYGKKRKKGRVHFPTQILTAKKKDPSADTAALERQIDKMVYKLYGLTPEEIAIVYDS